MKKILGALVLVLFLFASCAITQEYHFNSDFSGSAATKIDLGQMIQFMKSMDTTGKADSGIDSIEHALDKIADKLKETGVSNIKLGWNEDKTVISLSYDFKNIEILNKTLSETGSGTDILGGMKGMDKIKGMTGTDENKKPPKFTVKGKKKLIYDAPEITNDTLFNNEQMTSMKDYYKYNLIFSFDRTIKKVNNEHVKLSSDKKSFEFSGSMFEIFAKGFSTDFTVKLGKK